MLDLHAIKFDPVFRARDTASYISGDIPPDILELMDLRGHVMNSCRGPLQRRLARRALRGKSQAEIAAFIRAHMPKDVVAHQQKVAAADGLTFIAPIYFCNFPAILKGWIDRVWTYDFAYGLTSAGWHGDVNGRVPLLHHKRALLMTSTIFDEKSYDDGIRDAITRVIDDWGFRFPALRTSNTCTSTARPPPPPTSCSSTSRRPTNSVATSRSPHLRTTRPQRPEAGLSHHSRHSEQRRGQHHRHRPTSWSGSGCAHDADCARVDGHPLGPGSLTMPAHTNAGSRRQLSEWAANVNAADDGEPLVNPVRTRSGTHCSARVVLVPTRRLGGGESTGRRPRTSPRDARTTVHDQCGLFLRFAELRVDGTRSGTRGLRSWGTAGARASGSLMTVWCALSSLRA